MLASGEQEPISRLLIVDDDEAQLRTLCRLMEYEGFDIIACSNAAEALKQVKENNFSVAVIDYRLPDLTGTQLLDAIHKANGRIRVIIHTAYGSFESAKDSVNLGAFAYIEKASDPTKLIRHVHQAFRDGLDHYTKNLQSDIAERSASLKLSEEKYRVLVQSMSEGLIVQDVDRRITYVNDRMCEMWGYTRDELFGKDLIDFFDPDTNRILQEKWSLRSMGNRSSYELQLKRKDGSIVYTIISPQPIFDSNHRLVSSFAVITDITEWKNAKQELQQAYDSLEERVQERTADLTDAISQLRTENTYRKRAETQLIESSRQLHMALSALEGGTWDWDIQSGHVRFSSNWSRMLGYEPHEIIPHVRIWEEALHPDDKPRVMKVLADHFEGRTPTYQSEHRMKTKSGDWIWVLDRGRVVERDENGKPTRMMGTDLDINERRLAEDALQESRERFRTLVEHAPEAIFLFDCDSGRFVNVNEHAVELTGISREELTTKGPADISPHRQPDGRLSTDAAKEWVQKTLQGQAPVFEWMHQNADGVPVLCEVRLVRFPGTDRHLVRASITDITNRKRAEDALVNLAKLVDENPSPVFRVSSDGTILYANPSSTNLLKIWSCQIGEKLPLSFQRIIHDVLESGKSQEVEVDIGQRVFSIIFRPVIEHNYVNLYAHDVTQRKRAEDRIRRQAFVFDNMYDGVLLTDLEGRITGLNPSAERMFGYSKEELLGQKPDILNLPEDAANITRTIQEGIDHDGMWSGEIIFVRKDDTQGICEAFLVPLCDEKGCQVGIASVNRDVTDRKEAERAKAQLEEQLRISQKMEAVGTLASGIAHEFDNLLTAIFTYTELAKNTLPDNHQAVRALEKVEQTAKLARNVTLALLTFSHRAVFRKQIVNLSATLSETIDLLARLLPNNIEIIDDIRSENDLFIKADPGQIQQILMNLALNARDAMPEDGQLRVSLCQIGSQPAPPSNTDSPADIGWAELKVEDTGQGMSAETLSHIFEPFFTTKTRGQGTGLGMSVLLGIVDDLGGHIDVQSEINHGTCVTMTLPCCRPDPESSAGEQSLRIDRKRSDLILVIERNEHIRSIITSTLRTRGYEVVSAANMQEALRAICNRARLVGLLIFDLNISDRQGLASLQQLRSQRMRLPIIIMAGTLAIDLKMYGIEDGYLLRKPFQMSDLVAAVSHLLARSKCEEIRDT